MDLKGHKKRLEYLEEQIARLDEEAKAHKNILKIGSDVRILKAADDLINPRVTREMKQDQKRFLQRRGINLPKGYKVDIRRTIQGCTVFVRLAESPFKFDYLWDSEHGFSVSESKVKK